jgi:hypothetical protein
MPETRTSGNDVRILRLGTFREVASEREQNTANCSQQGAWD